ncbi:RNA polymerase sigma-70 factor [Sphingobacterium spiritivorum ATCC 33300]|uniref:RNA polymerase sigma-70 factor n=1 Tax=Sphingobacterium spiritivorum ATCC 33300 TaxID=525372 RepID=C2FTH4_SPHSI|nr:RNA polymerase sigma-70 factor [Sphingobacterium spiritivorum]EEI93777.1 RNA polymerase sigma-70 factor [Sphingobacterium spiritivorum ATCC 33300]QQS98200.1 RNA polymerase sigma-70 factor [Sphingobacterium spiritivorum]
MPLRNKQYYQNTLLTDQQLWVTVQIEDCQIAFATLYDRFWSLIYTTTFSYLNDREKSEEITLDIFLNLWNRRQYLQIRSFSAYLRTCARYHVYKALKDLKENQIAFSQYQEHTTETSVSNLVLEKMEQEDIKSSVDDVLKELPPRCQEIFQLSRFEHLSNDEIAIKLGISKRSVENQITKALKHLRIAFRILSGTVILLTQWLKL